MNEKRLKEIEVHLATEGYLLVRTRYETEFNHKRIISIHRLVCGGDFVE